MSRYLSELWQFSLWFNPLMYLATSWPGIVLRPPHTQTQQWYWSEILRPWFAINGCGYRFSQFALFMAII